ncbi:hypothetical protein KJ866_01460 [Patescibacteria group bacterium]|nr:hypothetical protein [Patescibacteria group bacterium]
MDKDLQKIIESAGFSDKEAKVYLALLELSRGTVAQIAKLSELKRPIVYVVLEKLIKGGYISQLPGGKINRYQALDPSVILNEKRLALKNFSEMLPLLQTLHNKGQKRPKIHYIETKEGIWNIYEKMNLSKEAFFISSYTKIEKYYPQAVRRWIKNYKKGYYNVIGRHLIPNNPEEKQLCKEFTKIKQTVRFLPCVKEFNMDFTLYENKLALTSFEEEPFMVLIESEELVKSIRPIFEIAWKAGKPV